MNHLTPGQVKERYDGFDAAIATFDCGKMCASFNEGIPFCCDSRHAVPTAYPSEWQYLQNNTNLWHIWDGADPQDTVRLQKEAGEGAVLIECLGHQHCQRGFRSFVCRAFPFYPYVDSHGNFLGLSYYLEYADRCWVISNLQVVTDNYREQFIQTYDQIFKQVPEEQETYHQHSNEMRNVFTSRRQTIPLLHRNGEYYKISPKTQRLRKVDASLFPKYEPYKTTDKLLFPDELEILTQKK